MNVLRLSLHPLGIASHIVNLVQWRAHLFERLRQQITATADPALVALLDELKAYPVPDEATDLPHHAGKVRSSAARSQVPRLAAAS